MSHRSCCVVNCKNTSRKSECTFFKFPTSKWKINQRNKWLAAVRRQKLLFLRNSWTSRTCSARTRFSPLIFVCG